MAAFCYERNHAVVDTTNGRLRGFEQGGIYTFHGIKYATARRFHAPEPIEPAAGITDATSYGYVCPLMSQEAPHGELFVPHRFWPMDEDCLNLNVWTPALDGAKRPVLVWLHGGGYVAGSAIEQAAYDGHNMALHGDAVVVSVNHRLNILGYFDLSDFGEEYENSGNAGGDDIIAALRWVHDNIGAFGGDPDNVTVFGQSGGGGKVTTLLQSPEADGLYAKGFNMSGVLSGPKGSAGLIDDCTGSGREIAEAIMDALNVKDVKGLEAVPYKALADAYSMLRPEYQKAGKYVGCAPHPNKHYLGDPVKVGFRPETSSIPLLVGSVFGEFTSFGTAYFDKHDLSEAEQREIITRYIDDATADRLLALYRRSYPDRLPVDLLRIDTMFRPGIIEYVRTRAALNNCTYSYMFNMDQPMFGGLTPWHCADIPYVFHNIDLVGYPNGSPDAAHVQDMVFESVMAFARTGSPANPTIPEWQPSAADAEHTLIIDANSRVGTNYDHELVTAASEAFGPVFRRIMSELSGQAQH